MIYVKGKKTLVLWSSLGTLHLLNTDPKDFIKIEWFILILGRKKKGLPTKLKEEFIRQRSIILTKFVQVVTV